MGPSCPLPLCSVAVKCSVCKSVSDTYDPYLDIALEIRVCLAVICVPGGDEGEREARGINSKKGVGQNRWE